MGCIACSNEIINEYHIFSADFCSEFLIPEELFLNACAFLFTSFRLMTGEEFFLERADDGNITKTPLSFLIFSPLKRGTGFRGGDKSIC